MMATNNIKDIDRRHKQRSLTSRASSATLLLAKHLLNRVDGTTDELSIDTAGDSLEKHPPHIPPWRSSSSPQRSIAESSDHPAQCDAASVSRHKRQGIRSNTWTSSSIGSSGEDDMENREAFVTEYNRLAPPHNVDKLVPDGYVAAKIDKVILTGKEGSSIMQRLIRRTSVARSGKNTFDKQLRHRRSVSDISMRLPPKTDCLKDKPIGEFARLCGTSLLHLPPDYATGALTLPTCIRAPAHYLLQHGIKIKEVFRRNGQQTKINEIYNYYALQHEGAELVQNTVRNAALPDSLQLDVYDVADVLKKFLSALPGGILGKTWLFDGLVSIHHAFGTEPEAVSTGETHIRARLIALAIASHPSAQQREVICAVFGLLCLVGRTAETAPREMPDGQPLPTAGLMRYHDLGIIFGPLLLQDLIDEFRLPAGASKAANAPVSSNQNIFSRSLRGKHRKSRVAEDPSSRTQELMMKWQIASHITEMLITHWRDVIRQMKDIYGLKTIAQLQGIPLEFSLPRPPQLYPEHQRNYQRNEHGSPTPGSDNRRQRPASQIDLSSPRFDTLSVQQKPDIRAYSYRLPDSDSGNKGRRPVTVYVQPSHRADTLAVNEQRPDIRVYSPRRSESRFSGSFLSSDLFSEGANRVGGEYLKTAAEDFMLPDPHVKPPIPSRSLSRNGKGQYHIAGSQLTSGGEGDFILANSPAKPPIPARSLYRKRRESSAFTKGGGALATQQLSGLQEYASEGSCNHPSPSLAEIAQSLRTASSIQSINSKNSNTAEEVPQGIVSQRVKGITDSDAGLLPPHFQALMQTGVHYQNTDTTDQVLVHPALRNQYTPEDWKIQPTLKSRHTHQDALTHPGLRNQRTPQDAVVHPALRNRHRPQGALIHPAFRNKDTTHDGLIYPTLRNKEAESVKAIVEKINRSSESLTPTPSLQEVVRIENPTADSSLTSTVVSPYTSNQLPNLRSNFHPAERSLRSAPATLSGQRHSSPLYLTASPHPHSGRNSLQWQKPLSPARQQTRSSQQARATMEGAKSNGDRQPTDPASGQLRTRDGHESFNSHTPAASSLNVARDSATASQFHPSQPSNDSHNVASHEPFESFTALPPGWQYVHHQGSRAELNFLVNVLMYRNRLLTGELRFNEGMQGLLQGEARNHEMANAIVQILQQSFGGGQDEEVSARMGDLQLELVGLLTYYLEGIKGGD